MPLTTTAKHKAATLLMNLDAAMASELLKDLPPEEVQQIAVEMAQLKAAGQQNKKQEAKIIHNFCKSLRKSQTQKLNINTFLKTC